VEALNPCATKLKLKLSSLKLKILKLSSQHYHSNGVVRWRLRSRGEFLSPSPPQIKQWKAPLLRQRERIDLRQWLAEA
jgi:hypothetical protein